MINWFNNSNRKYPDFWKNYLSKFEIKNLNRFVVLDIETSGMSFTKDVIYSIRALGVANNTILIGDNFEVMLLQYKFLHDNELSNEFIIESKLKKLSEPEAVKIFLDFVGNAFLVGENISFTVEMLNATLQRMDCGKLKNQILDINAMHQKIIDNDKQKNSLEELFENYKITNKASKENNKIYNLALLFLKFKNKLMIK